MNKKIVSYDDFIIYKCAKDAKTLKNKEEKVLSIKKFSRKYLAKVKKEGKNAT